jgi:TPR repeat protein
MDKNDEPPYYAPLKAHRYDEAIRMLKAAIAKQEDAHAMSILGSLLAMGQGIERDEEEACAWFRQSAVRGDVFGQTAFGTCLAMGIGIRKDETESAYWLYRAGKAGYLKAISILSDLVLKNQAVVGPHFSMDDYMKLVRKGRKPLLVH